jgi:hypothetical protein
MRLAIVAHKLIIQPVLTLSQFIIAAVLAVAAAAPSSYATYEKTYEKDYKYPEFTAVGSSKWRSVDKFFPLLFLIDN